MTSWVENTCFIIGDAIITSITYSQISISYFMSLYSIYIHPIPVVQTIVSRMPHSLLTNQPRIANLSSFLNYPIEYVRNNRVVYTTTVYSVFVDRTNLNIIADNKYDFIICSKPCETNNKIYKKVLYPSDVVCLRNSTELLNSTMNIQESTNQFISCSVEERHFTFEDADYSFNVVGNQFDSTFFNFLFHTYYSTINYDPKTSAVHLIDSNVNMHELLPTSVLSLTEDTYFVGEKK